MNECMGTRDNYGVAITTHLRSRCRVSVVAFRFTAYLCLPVHSPVIHSVILMPKAPRLAALYGKTQHVGISHLWHP